MYINFKIFFDFLLINALFYFLLFLKYKKNRFFNIYNFKFILKSLYFKIIFHN